MNTIRRIKVRTARIHKESEEATTKIKGTKSLHNSHSSNNQIAPTLRGTNNIQIENEVYLPRLKVRNQN